MNQCLVWFTFSSIDKEKVIEYYGSDNMNESTLALLLNWGPIIGIVMFPLQVWITQRGVGGFQHAAILGSTLVFVGTVVRTVPCLCGEAFRQSMWAIALLHIGQISNAAGGPLCMGTESRLSCIWFCENERATATAVAVTSNGVGATLGFLLGPWVATTADRLPNLLYLEVVLAAIPFLCCIIHYPSRPSHPPSAAAAVIGVGGPSGQDAPQDVDGRGAQGKSPAAEVSFMQGLRLVSRNRHFCVLVLAAGIIAGVQAAWQSLLQAILSPSGYTDKMIGYLGFAAGLSGNIGSVLFGFLSDTVFRRRFKATIMGLFLLLLFANLWFTLSVPMTDSGSAILPQTLGTIFVAICLAGLAQSATSPLLYELCAELTYPVPEGTSAGILALLWNFFSLVVIFISPLIPPGAVSGIYTATSALVIVMVGTVKEVYKRPSSHAIPSQVAVSLQS